MPKKINYQAGIRALIRAGDFTSLSDVLKIAPVSHMAKAAGMGPDRFARIIKAGFTFTYEEIEGMAEYLEIPVQTMEGMVEKDRASQK